MAWMIAWDSYFFDEIKLVYERFEHLDPALMFLTKIMQKLEEDALSEAQAWYEEKLTEEQKAGLPASFSELSDTRKEELIDHLSGDGLSAFFVDRETAAIIVELSPKIQRCRACTIFRILNQIEKLDGSLNIIFPECTLKMFAPYGGQGGLQMPITLISMLFPWLTCSLQSSNQLAEGLI